MKSLKSLFILLTIYASNNALAQSTGEIFNSVVGNNSEPVLYNAVNLNTYQLLTTNIQVSKDDNLQKVVLSPFKLSNKTQANVFRESKINLAQKNGISTFGLGLGIDNSSPFSKRGDKILASVQLKTIPIKDTSETQYEYDIKKAKIKRENREKYADAYKELLENSLKFTLGFNTSLFSIIGGDKVDLDNDSIIDNYHVLNSYDFSLGFTYVFSLKSAISVTPHYTQKYGSAKEDEKLVDYIGGSLSFAHQVLVLNKDYDKSEDYLNSLFVPSIVLGASLEYQKAMSNEEYAQDNIIEALVVTPFVDFKITPKNQLRFGIPIKKFNGINDEIAFGPFIQWSLQIAKID